jgi:hypothetical protein
MANIGTNRACRICRRWWTLEIWFLALENCIFVDTERSSVRVAPEGGAGMMETKIKGARLRMKSS